MTRSSNSGGCHVDLAGIGLCVADELGNGFSRNRGIHYHDKRCSSRASDWRGVTDEVEIQLVKESRVECIGCGDLKERITIGRRPNQAFSGDIATGTGPILYNEWLTEM